MRRAIAICGALLLMFGIAQADSENLALLDLQLNRQDKGEILVIVRHSEVLAKVTDLQGAGLASITGKIERIRGDEYVALSSLAPAVDYRLDEKDLLLIVSAKPELLGETRINLGRERPSDITYSHDTSGFLNYAVNLRQFSKFDAFMESGISVGRGLLYSSAFRNDQGAVVRGMTNYSIDSPQRLTTWTFGDQLANSVDPLGGAAFVAGISYSKNFSLDPYFTRFPTEGLSGALSTPSKVDVYMNGHLVREELLPPGQFQLNNLPFTLGSGAAQVVIKDALGNQTEINSAYYQAIQVLQPGLSDYSYDVGLVRNQIATSSFDYGKPLLLLRHRYGLTDWFTPGFRVEASPSLVSGGSTADMRLPFGTLEASVGASQARRTSGGAASLAYSYIDNNFSAGGTVQLRSDRYTNASLTPGADRARVLAMIFIGFPLGANISVYPQYACSEYRDAGWQDQLSIAVNLRLSERLSAFLSLADSRQSGPGSGLSGAISLNYFFGAATTASVSWQSQPQGSGPSIDIQKGLPFSPGFGYRLQAQPAAIGEQANGSVQYQNSYGLYEADYGRVAGQDINAVSVAGGLVEIAHRFFLTRPVQQSFALIEVPDVPNVRGYLSNQELGRTDSRGDLLIPNLLPYYGNLLGIEDQDIPLDHSVEANQKLVAPPNRGGAIVTFPVNKLRAIVGKIEVRCAGRRLTPAAGELTVERTFVSPTGRNGEFYLDGLPAGRHQAHLEFDGGECSFDIDVSESGGPIFNLGTLVCEARVHAVVTR